MLYDNMKHLRTDYEQIVLIMSSVAIVTRRLIECHLALKMDDSSAQYARCSDQNFSTCSHQWLTIIRLQVLNPIPEFTIYL